MKTLTYLLTILTILLTGIQAATAQESVQVPIDSIVVVNQGNVLDLSSAEFEAELQRLQENNPQLGPNHDLVYPGQPIFLDDETVHIIQPGEYESMILLEYLRQQNIDPNKVVAIGRPGDQSLILISQDSGTDWPWYIWLPIWITAAALVWKGFNSSYSGEMLSRIHGVISEGGVNIKNDHHYPPRDDKEKEEDESGLAILLFDMSRDTEKERQPSTIKDSPNYENSAPVFNTSGSGNTVNVHIHPSEDVGETSETESKTEET